MKKVLVLGSAGFIGRNLMQALVRRCDVAVSDYDLQNGPGELDRMLAEADVIYHLAGVNRPLKTEDYEAGNAGFTKNLVARLEALGRVPDIIFASSIQATMDNPYGQSKRHAEEALRSWSNASGAAVALLRFPNVFGKWCRPNYNSVVATFCYNISRGLDINVSDRAHELDLVYVDDVVLACLHFLDSPPQGVQHYCDFPTFKVNLGQIADTLYAFKSSRRDLSVPDFSNPWIRGLYATYLSYLPEGEFDYPLARREDGRGVLAELLKAPSFGQIFISRTKPGAVRGNHYHDTKAEKFCVLEGDAMIRMRDIRKDDVITFRLSGRDLCVVDIPPGYVHSIQNMGDSEMIVLFWANEPYDVTRPDTFPLEVTNE